MSRRILQVFNRYLQAGGEEQSVDRIARHIAERHTVARLFFDSREWTGPQAPSRFTQARRLFYNPDAARRLESAVREAQAEVLLFHNVWPIGGAALYETALRLGLPVIQFCHNYRPFSVSGGCYAGGRVCPESLRGHHLPEVWRRGWQNSRIKSALLACALTRLRGSGWLESVRAWVGVSHFVRDRLLDAGLRAERVHALPHSWDAMPDTPAEEDRGHYLFLGRLVEDKGVRVLLDAWRRLGRERGARVPELVLAGEGPLAEEVLLAAVPGVRAVGPVGGEAKRELLRGCRAVVIPSVWWEPLARTLYEAYDHAKPALCAASGGLTEAVEPGVTAFLHAPGSADGLAADVARLEDLPPSQRREMGLAGRGRLLRDADPGRWQDGFDRMLEGVLPPVEGSGGF